MTAVWENSGHQSGALIVLLAMADWADDNGGSIFPSVQKLAFKSRLKDRQVQRVIRTLLASGELVLLDQGGGRHQTNSYRIPMPFRKGVIKTPFEKGVICDTKRVSFATQKGVTEDTPIHQEPSLEPLGAQARRRARARKTTPGFSSQAEVCMRSASFRTLNSALQEARNEIETITHPGGCAQYIEPKSPEKHSQLEAARRKLSYARSEIELLMAKTPAAGA